MDWSIALILFQDGIVNGAIYALLGLALVLVFTVTRIVFIPQGEFVAFGALTLAMLSNDKTPGTVWLLALLGLVSFLVELIRSYRQRQFATLPKAALTSLVFPGLLLWWLPGMAAAKLSLWLDIILTLVLVVPMGPMLYRIVYRPLADASVLVLLIISVALHFALMGLALAFFGAEGWRTPEFVSGSIRLGDWQWPAQGVLVLAASSVMILALWLLFDRTLYGKALRATAVNRRGARLVGISTESAGVTTLTLAALIGAFSGILIAPFTTLYYDSGFLIGLKGFVAAIIGGLSSYPLTAVGALLVGNLESFSSFWASAFKEVMVFTLIIPVLLWRSLISRHDEDEE